MTGISWADQMQSVNDEAAGILRLEVFQPSDLPDLVLAALAGDAEAGGFARAINTALGNIARAPRRRPALCGSCPRPVRRNTAFTIVIAVPDRDEPSNAVTLAICSRCGVTHDDVRNRAVEALRRIWPDGRLIQVAHPAGHA